MRTLSGEVKLKTAQLNSNSTLPAGTLIGSLKGGASSFFCPEPSVNPTRSTITGGGLVLSRNLDGSATTTPFKVANHNLPMVSFKTEGWLPSAQLPQPTPSWMSNSVNVALETRPRCTTFK